MSSPEMNGSFQCGQLPDGIADICLEVPAERGVGIPLGSMEGIPMSCLNIKKPSKLSNTSTFSLA